MATPNKKAKRAQDKFNHKVLFRAKATARADLPPRLTALPQEIPRLYSSRDVVYVLYDPTTGDTMVLAHKHVPVNQIYPAGAVGTYNPHRTIYFQTRSDLDRKTLSEGLGIQKHKIEIKDYSASKSSRSLLQSVGLDPEQQNTQARRELSDLLGF